MALMNVRLKDLSGTLRKTSEHAFGAGQNANIWLGEFKDRQSCSPWRSKLSGASSTEADVMKLNEKLLREARLWSTLKHVNVMPFLGITTDMARYSAPSLVSPYYKNGSLDKYVASHNLTDRDKMDLLCQFASGLAYLHSCKVVHGDIKPAVLADFGLSRVLEVTGFTTNDTPGTLRYMAPELLIGEPAPGTTSVSIRTSTAADVWAFAITATEIFSTTKPYQGSNEGAVVLYVRDGGTLKYDDYKGSIREGLWSMLVECWKLSLGRGLP
ncbi:kinase-like domain-containing protein [Melanogaster broomeanus]|nr:kinase-like domain-containing protein [Melanogaster broomeanus]